MNITKSAPLPERLCERIAYCAILLTVYEADYSVVVAQSEGADHRRHSTPEMQNILLQNVVGHVVRKAKNFAGGATDTILSGRQVLINLMSDFVLDKTKATAEGRQWVLRQIKLERITNNATFAAGGQCDQCAGLLVGYQPFGSIPRRFSSALANSLNQLPRVRPSEVAASFTCWRSSLLILIWKVGDHPSPRGDLSRFNVDMYVRNSYYHCCYVRTISVGTVKSKAPQVSLPLAGLLTTNDNESIEVAMRNHTTHPQGRDSHNLNKYIWRFIALSTAQPRVIHIEATSEQEARQQSPDGCVMVFAARIRQEVHHVQ
ncbi:host cell division inhibitor Icd-like protein [Escherichia coli]|nr:host cell division inhibitor Icd-like protein [Escherichia coli]